MRRLILALRLVLGVVFVYAAYTKLRQPWLSFAMSIDAYQILPEWAVLVLGHWLPWVELAIGIFLITGILLPYVAAGAAGLLMVFFVLMARAFIKGMTINCGCFGLGEEISAQTLVRDGLLVVASIALTVIAFRPVHRVKKITA